MTEYSKDPDAIRDFKFDWTDWLGASETIASYVLTAAAGIVIDQDSNTNLIVTARISGGVAGTSYTLACRITTDAGQVDERTLLINVFER